MKVFKNLFAVSATVFFLSSCSQHTTCSAYGASTYQIDDNQYEINVQSEVENEDWM